MRVPPPMSRDETPPQCLGDFKPVDEWQDHLNALFYGLRGGRVRDYYQTMASADYRLAHALAAEFHEAHRNRQDLPSNLLIHEWGCGNGNLAACFLSHLRHLDTAGTLYGRVHYVLIDNDPETLRTALEHPDLQGHRTRVSGLQADAQDLAGVRDKTVHWILCNELWSDLRTKVMLRKEGEIIEEQIRPNLSDAKSREFGDWFGFVKNFAARDVGKLRNEPSFLDEIIWEKDYQPIDWKRIPYRKTITEFMRAIDDLVLVPVNLGAFATVREAQRLLAAGGRFVSLDAGTPDTATVASPDKPCYALHGGQYSFIMNFALCEAVARHLGIRDVSIESQKEFVSRMLGQNLMTVVDLLETYPFPGKLEAWERDRLILRTLKILSACYESPYRRTIDYPIHPDTPEPGRGELAALLRELPAAGVPDTIAYLAEEEVLCALPELESLGFSREDVQDALRSAEPAGPIGYYRFSVAM
jgi:hypothetical protein